LYFGNGNIQKKLKISMKSLVSAISIFSFFLLSAFTSDTIEQGSFACKLNGRDLILKDAKAKYRTITGGYKQLSLSNDKFEAFVLLNPEIRKINLTENNNREVYVRYIEPGTDKMYKPLKGFVDIQKLDLETGVVSGIFEMELVNREGAIKKITVTNGKFENVQIRIVKAF